VGEVGDLSANQTVFLNGFAVQRIADQNDQAMTPLGATDAQPVDFVLKTDGSQLPKDRSSSAQLAGLRAQPQKLNLTTAILLPKLYYDS
jgi:hypothetical protein